MNLNHQMEGTSSAVVLLMKNVTVPTTSSAAAPWFTSPSSVINALPLNLAN